MPVYQRYFDNFFATLPVSRAAFHGLAAGVLRAVHAADLGPGFLPLLAELEAALRAFDVRRAPTPLSPSAAAFREARRHWLAFVDDTMKDHVTPKLRRQPAHADFRRYARRRLSQLEQPELLRQSRHLLGLYVRHAAELGYLALPADAGAVFQQLIEADQACTIADAEAAAGRSTVPADWLRLARALRRVKGMLEAHLDEPAAVYAFFAQPHASPAPRPHDAAVGVG